MSDELSSWRELFLRAAVWFGVAVALITEIFGAAGLLRRGPLLAAWALVGLIAGWALARRGLKPPNTSFRLFESLAGAGILALAAVVGLTALASPPNSADAMAYHLPRVVYWTQAASVDFFPTLYFNQIMLPPLAEYMMLHAYVLTGGDRFVNLVQFFGFFGSVIGVSAIAKVLGAGARGQAIAAVFCATIPNGILQASGAKNDALLALWLVAMVYFALRGNWPATGLALGLALLTKGTAYLFAPPLLAAAWFAAGRRPPWRAATIVAAGVLLLNGPQYLRNFDLSGSPLGFDSAEADGRFRWRNESLGLRPALSNVMRNLAAHLGHRSPVWNQGVYDAVVRAHASLGIDPNDPATTWPGDRFRPPVNSNHEADSPNRWHLLLLALAAIPVWRSKRWLVFYLSLVAGFLLFCFYLKWMPWITRLHLPLFVLGSVIIGLIGERLRPALAQAALCLFLLNSARPYLFENWTRRLIGSPSVLRTPREAGYFNDMTFWGNRAAYERSVELLARSGCSQVGIDASRHSLEYPIQALLRQSNPAARFEHVGVHNVSARYQPRDWGRPCAVVCMECGADEEKIRQYRAVGEPHAFDRFLVFLPR